MYVAFTDLRKAFDSIERASLFLTFVKAGLSGPFLNAIKTVVSCVHNKVADFFDLKKKLYIFFYRPFGVKHGCIPSPALFSLFVNEIAIGMEAVGKHGIQLQPGLVELFLLLFADDLALLSSISMGLQNQLNHLDSICKEHPLSINTEKSEVVIFRKGGFLGKNEKRFLKGMK